MAHLFFASANQKFRIRSPVPYSIETIVAASYLSHFHVVSRSRSPAVRSIVRSFAFFLPSRCVYEYLYPGRLVDWSCIVAVEFLGNREIISKSRPDRCHAAKRLSFVRVF